MKIFKQGELKLFKIFYLEALLSSIFVFFPAFMIIYFANIGLSFFQISLITTVLLFFRFIFEIPTGAVADVFGRKLSVLVGLFIAGLAFFSLLFFDNFYYLIIIFAILGFAGTFESGARESWVVDLIKKEKKNNLQQHYFVKIDSITSIGIVLSGILGAFFVKQFGLSSIWFFGGIACFSSFFLLLFAKENFIKRKVKMKDSFRNLVKQSKISIKYVRHHNVLFLFLIATAIIAFASEFNGSLAWVPFLKNLGFPDYAFGYLWSAMGIVGIFAPFISLKSLKKGRERKFILNLIILTILVLSLVIFSKSVFFTFIILLSQLFLSGMSRPVERNYFHKLIKSKLRATVGSVEGMLLVLASLLAMPLTGLSIDSLGAKDTILISALLMIPSVIIFLKIKDEK